MRPSIIAGALLAAFACSDYATEPPPGLQKEKEKPEVTVTSSCVTDPEEVCELDPIDVVVCRGEGTVRDSEGNCWCEDVTHVRDADGDCYDPDEDDDGDDGGGGDGGGEGGGGGGGGDDDDDDEDDEDDDEERRVVEFTLVCGTVQRGSTGGCSVETSDTLVNLDSLTYEWTAAGHEVSGTGIRSWTGIATSTRTVSVTVKGPGLEDAELGREVVVTARKWAMPEVKATIDYALVSDTTWGEHTYTPQKWKAEPGSGPWGNEYYMVNPGWVTGASIAMHVDFLENGPIYADTLPIDSLLLANFCESEPATDSMNVHGMNALCGKGYPGNLEAFRRQVEAHEKEHTKSLNKCLTSKTITNLLAEMESLKSPGTVAGGEDLRENVKTIRDKMLDALNLANTTNLQGETAPEVWQYRLRDEWHPDPGNTPDHTGTWGC